MKLIARVKLAHGRRWPYYRRCLYGWCWRGQTNQTRCHVHQRDRGRHRA